MDAEAIDYIPHSKTMSLIDKIVDVGEEHIECTAQTADLYLFRNSQNKIPSWIGIELMAQTIGAYAGWNDVQKNKPVKVGFLLGSRKLSLYSDSYEDKSLIIRAELVFRDEELGSFKCTIFSPDRERILAEATVNVFQPQDIVKFVNEIKK